MSRPPLLALFVLLIGLAMSSPTILMRGELEKRDREESSSTSISSASSSSSSISTPSVAPPPLTPGSKPSILSISTSTRTVDSASSSDSTTSSSSSLQSTASPIDVSSLLSSLSNDLLTTQSTARSTYLSDVLSTSTNLVETTKPTKASISSSISIPTSGPESSSNSSSSHRHRDLVISLSTILSFLGLIGFLIITYLLIRRHRRSITRPSTPITDTEIAQWRGTSTSPLTRLPGTPQSQHQTFNSYGEKEPLQSQKISPTIARAPNSRTGLTDETVPGDEPFIGKRRASKKSKHAYGASVSKSVRSEDERPSTWYDDDAVLQRSSKPKGTDKEEYG